MLQPARANRNRPSNCVPFSNNPILAAALAVSFLIAPLRLSAQQPVLEEILVTAQKREQNMMDVPVAITAVSPRDLEIFGVRDTADLTKISPSLTYDQAGDRKSVV